MKLINHVTQRNNTLIEIRDINGFVADYIMQHLYELHTEEQRVIIYNLCSNLYRAQHELELILVNKGVSINERSYNPKSFTSVKYINLDIQRVVADFVEKQKDNQSLIYYRQVLASLSK